ncbi:proprotein convertase P-domain-containing protein [Zavarzinella formosa]|uniref:proprotein convertase P-domain-containing protein n=1 Tax=Zavarzinella formosa TaxID=360055 RepID=UPI00031BDCB8|nr:proprotein convertase P-domain-containing protein [Zavarzinella formosa]
MNFESITRRLRRQYFQQAGNSPRRSSVRTQSLILETLENREVPATLIGPVIDYTTTTSVGTTGIAITGFTATGTIAPTIVADPTNPNQLFGAVQYMDNSGNSRIGFIYSGNAGQTWTSNSGPIQNGNDENAASPSGGFIPFSNVSNPAVAYDNFHNVYLTYVEHNVGSTAGRLVLRKYSFVGTPIEQNINNPDGTIHGSSTVQAQGTSGNEKTLYKWLGTDAVFNPTVAIDTNLASFTDNSADAIADKPNVADRTQTDPFAATQTTADKVKVFVAWNTFDVVPSGNDATFVRSKIRMTVSQDGGKNFGPQVLVNNQDNRTNLITGGNYQGNGEEYTAPKIVFTQGRAGLADSGGKMITMFSGTVLNNLYADSYNFSTNTANDVPGQDVTLETPESVEYWTNNFQPLNDAFNGSPIHITNITTYDLTVPTDPLITRLDKLSVTLALYSNSLDELKIDLVAPPDPALGAAAVPVTTGGPGTYAINPLRKSITLVRNKLDAGGNNTGNGISGTDLGRLKTDGNGNAFNFGTTFEDNAARRINDPTAVNGFAGSFKPEGGSLDTVFGGMTAAQLAGGGGVWTIVVTDFRYSGSPAPNFRQIARAGIKISQDFKDDLTDSSVSPGAETATGAGVAANNFSGTGNPTASVANPAGLGASVSVATDNTLGLYSPYQNRIYAAYFNGGGTQVIYSDDDGLLWSSTASDVSGPVLPSTILGPVTADTNTGLFNPKITVDPTTGTVLVSSYSNAQDPTGKRSLTMLSTSINGAAFEPDPTRTPLGTIEFSKASPVNPFDTTYDQINTKSDTVQYVPSNGPAMASITGNEVFGNNMGLVSYGGVVKLLYTGNVDQKIAQVRTQQLKIASGPRIVGSDSGVVLGAAQIDDLHDNTIDVDLGVVAKSSTFDFNAIRQLFDPNGKLFSITQAVTVNPINAIGGSVTPGVDSRFFRIGLPTSAIAGTYKLNLRNGFLTTPGGVALNNFPTINSLVTTRTISYNVPTANGQVFDAFYVEFDRVIDPSTFTPADIDLRYRASNEDSTVGGRRITGLTIQPLDTYIDPVLGTHYGSKRFLVRLTNPEPAANAGQAGTYSYTIGRLNTDPLKPYESGKYGATDSSSISDRIRSFQIPSSLGATTTRNATTILGVPQAPVTLTDQLGSVQTTVTSTIQMPNPVPPAGFTSAVVGVVTLQINVTHTRLSDLEFKLRAPNGQIIQLFNAGDLSGGNMINTVFDDAAPTAITDVLSVAPYTGTFQAVGSLATFKSSVQGGNWTLIMTDRAAGVQGQLDSWSLSVTQLNVGTPVLTGGNLMDQNGNSLQNEDVQDVYAVPTPQPNSNGLIRPFVAPFADQAMPIVVPGPRVVNTEIMVQNPDYFDVDLGQVVDTSSFTWQDITSITGPSGALTISPALTIEPVTGFGGNPLLPATTNSRYFRIHYTSQLGAGQYQVKLGNPAGTSITTPTATPIPFPNLLVGQTTQTPSADFIDVDIGQVVDASTFTSADLVQITGPAGDIPVADPNNPISVLPITDIGGTRSSVNSRYFRIYFTNLEPSGKYDIVLKDGDVATNTGIFMPRAPVDPTKVEPPYLPLTPAVFPASVTGHTTSPENVVYNSAATYIDVKFDRVMNSSTFTRGNPLDLVNDPDDILRIIGPNGDIPLTGVTINPIDTFGGTIITGNSQYFRIAFPGQPLPGDYQIQIGSNISDVSGNQMDKDTNAGVSVLDGSPAVFPLPPGATVIPQSYSASPTPSVPTIIPALSTVSIPLTINGLTDGYQIQKITANLSANVAAGRTMRDLEARLVSPDGTIKVLLFQNAPRTGSTSSITDVTFDDSATAPVQNGFAGAGGSNNPTQPLAQLNGILASGTWNLEIKNTGPSVANVSKFALTINKYVIGDGLGDPIADQTSLGYRVTFSNELTTTGNKSWNPVGPDGNTSGGDTFNPISGASINGGHTPIDPVTGLPITPTTNVSQEPSDPSRTTAGRVSNIAVDPSDPSGNTVYASGASGGVWRTTNFLTRDPAGPNWVPLTDFGPNQVIRDANGNITRYGSAINVGSLTVVNETGDPLQTKIIVGTGSSALNLIDQADQVNPSTSRYDGVGFLISNDAGKTWNILDSVKNFDVPTNAPANTPAQYLDVTDPKRNHLFVGAVINKVVVEKKLTPNSNPLIMYAAVGRGSTPATDNVAGLWRTFDGGNTWTQIYRDPAGNDVTDFAIGEGSAQPNTLNRPTIGYVGVQGVGILITTNLNVANGVSFTLLNGGLGRPTVNQNGVSGSVPVGNSGTPNGAKGRIVLATPLYQPNNPLANNYYKGWLVAAVATPDGRLDGIYVTKDAGVSTGATGLNNWTKLKLTDTGGYSQGGNDIEIEFPGLFTTNNYFSGASVNGVAQNAANHSLTLALDPTDPNILYVGSDRIIRIDMTQVNDPYKLQLYSHTDTTGNEYSSTSDANTSGTGGGGLVRNDTTRGTPVLDSNTPVGGGYDTALSATRRKSWNFLNLKYNPYEPFLQDTTIFSSALGSFTNDGGDITWTEVQIDRRPTETDAATNAIVEGGNDYDWVSNIVTYVDPLTGKARVIYGHDEGIGTFVSNDDGTLNRQDGINQANQLLGNRTNLSNDLTNTDRVNLPINGSRNAVGTYNTDLPMTDYTDLQVNGNRNGNIQVARLYSGDVQPSYLAAGISNSLILGAARRLGDVYASQNDLNSTGTKTWDDVNRDGRANYVATDPTGSGTVYILRRINDIQVAGDPTTDFFQIQQQGGVPISRTNGLFQNSGSDPQGFGQWTNAVKKFTVNTIDGNGISMSSNVGRLFSTVDQGLNWFVSAEPSDLDFTYAGAVAYGAPVIPQAGDPPPTLNDYLYAGTNGGHIFVKTGNVLAPTWKSISTGLDGSPVLKIIANPVRGSNSAYAVTDKGVYFMQDWTSTDPQVNKWQNITGNLFSITGQAYQLGAAYQTTLLQKLTTIAVDWRPLTFATPGTPVLYAGGDGGVFRSLDNGLSWIRFTDNTTNAVDQGGGLPNVKITDLDLAVGNVVSATGRNDTTITDQTGQQVLPNLLVATTLGRGTWEIGLVTPNDTPTLDPIADQTINEDQLPAPQVINLTGITAGSGELTQNLTVTAISSDPSIIPDPTITYTSANSFGTLSYQPLPNQFTTPGNPVTITVIVKDDGGTLGGGHDTYTVTFKVTVRPVNDAPTLDPITPSAITVNEDSGATSVPLTGIADGDGGGQVLTITAVSSNPLVIPTPVITYTSANPTGTLTFTPLPNQFSVSPITITVRVFDNGGTSFGGHNNTFQTFTVVVNPVNDPPTFTKGPDIYTPKNAGPQTFPGWATNLSAGPANESNQFPSLAFSTSNSNPALFSQQPAIDANGQLTYTPATNATGTVQVTVTLSDNGGIANGGVDNSSQTFFILIGVNRAPVLTDPHNLELLPVGVDTTTSAGTLVSDLIANSITDQDLTDPRGIAVTGVTGSQTGSWQYSINNGGTWLDLSTVTSATARLLRPEDRVRYIPNTGFRGQTTLTFQAWDQSDVPTHVAGGTADLTLVNATGGSTAFSVDSATATARVVTILNTIQEDQTTNTGSNLKPITANLVTDGDGPSAKKGLAIVGTGGEIDGTWQYSINNGTTWLNFGTVGLTSARLLRDVDKVRFVPAPNQYGEVYLKFYAWDQSVGTFGQTANLTVPGVLGGNGAFSLNSDFLAVRVLPVNDRPILDTAAPSNLTTIDMNNVDPPGPVGDTVASVIGATVTDYDVGTVPGIAVTAVSTVGGQWQYKAPLDPNWTPIFGVTATKVLLLDPDYLIRFSPSGIFTGTATISYKAWDRSPGGGTAGQFFVGASTALSTGIKVGKLQVVAPPLPAPAPNAAPILDTAPVVTLPTIPEDSKPVSPLAPLVSAILGGAVTDDVGALQGIAVTGLTGTATGVWQYLPTGTTVWKPMGNVALETALLLKDTDRIRYLPNLNYNGTATISYRAWDRTQGTAGQLANLSLPGTTGGTSSVSSATETATVTVSPVNDVPVLSITPTPALSSLLAGTDQSLIAGNTVASLLGTAVTDVDAGALQGIALTKALTTHGQWQYQLNGSGIWVNVPTVSTVNALFLQPLDLLRFVPNPTFVGVEPITYRAWDQTPGTNLLVPASGTVASTTVNKGALSLATETATITIVNPAVNTRPVLDITPNVQLPNVAVGDSNPVGITPDTLLGTAVTDPDIGVVAGQGHGIAVTFVDNTNGTWQYFDGTSWQSLGGVTAANAILLSSTDLVRFLPNANFRGTTTFKYKAWDQSVGSHFTTFNTAQTTAFSAAIETASLTVNTAPVVS